MNEDLLALFRQTGALLDGHFILRSGLHSRQFFQCALLLQHTEIAARICGLLAEHLRPYECDAVISPALGGII
ncbi:MAG: orotate phosphoribosyltransferase, partial [Chthoniobacterales bacterium]